LLLMPLLSRATHIVGTEVYYECLGGNQYRITLKVYRDCLIGEAPFDNPASIAVYNGSNMLTMNLSVPLQSVNQMPVVINNPCLQAPPNICVEEGIYVTTVTLPPTTGGYTVAYQRCCRNGTIVNLTNPGSQGATSLTRISEEALASCNSNPSFNAFPPIALCAGDPLVFDHSATDPDGDLIVYSLCEPFIGGSQVNPAPNPATAPPYTTVTWGAAYSGMAPMNSDPQLSIDPSTGLLTGTPTQQGQFVVGVCAEEYRNGQLLSTNTRDFQFNVVSCMSFVAAVIPDPAAFHDPCTGRQVSFGNQSVNASAYLWDFGLTTTLDTGSTDEFPVVIFPDTGLYTVTLIANPGLPCADTASQSVMIYDPVIAEIPPLNGQCADQNAFDFTAGGQFGQEATFLWEFDDAQPPTSTDRDPQGIAFNSSGEFNVRLTVTEAICSDTDEATIVTYPRPQAQFAPGPHEGCMPLTVFFNDESYSGTERQVLWDFGDGGTSNQPSTSHTFSEAGTYDVLLTVWTTSGCVDTVSFLAPMDVTVRPLPSGELTVLPDSQSIFEPFFTFSATSDNALICRVDPGDGSLLEAAISGCDFEYAYVDTGTYLPILTVENEFGCVATDTALLRVMPEYRFWIPNAFTPNGNDLNEGWGPVALGVRDFQLWVFNRWGQQVWYTEDHRERWDGTLSNSGNLTPVPGVYNYRALFRTLEGKPQRRFGTVTVVR
jgi:gliding motility-associated-like protein